MRLRFPFIVIFIFFAVAANCQSRSTDYREGWLSIKVNPELRSSCGDRAIDVPQLTAIFNKLEADQVEKRFPHAEPFIPSRAFLPDANDKRVDLSLIYKIHYTSDIDPIKASKLLLNTGLVVYAEPWFINKTTVVPNDPMLGSMWHLDVIKAFEAWDIDTGSSNITIAIVDTGVDWDHPDMVEAIKINEIELNGTPGIDDDDNGYTDDTRGWNFFNENNDPNETGFSHGTHVAGLAGAVPNNNFGVAGTSWGCKILPVKAGDKLILPYAYEGVVYAADNGADVINCSWGGFSYTETGHDVMKYATYNHDAVVLGGAGNDNRETKFYPASFREVMSVGATDSINQKADFSNYNYEVDIIAPGVLIFSLKNGDLGYDSGTSMSAPIVAGAAALVRNKFPTLSALQVMEQLRVTSNRSVYDVSFNAPFEGKLGAGLLDMKRALEGINSPALRMNNYTLTDGDDDIFSIDEELFLGVEFFNYLNSIADLNVQITAVTSNVEVVEGSWSIPSVPTSTGIDNYKTPFSLKVNSVEAFDEEVIVKVTATSLPNDYAFERYISFDVNPSYVNVQVNRIKTTISKNGLFGYTDYFQTNGLGFQLDSISSLIFEGGLMIGHNTDGTIKVVDRVRGEDIYDRDFWEQSVISRQVPSGDQAYFANGSFIDSSARKDEIGLLIEQNVWAFDKPGHENYIILEYTIENQSDQDLTNLSAGLFADWDIENALENKGNTAYGKRMGYVYSTGLQDVSAGIQALSLYPFNCHMIDNVGGGNGGVDLFDEEGFTSGDKYTALNEERLEAGAGEQGNDVIEVTSMKQISLPKNEKITVAFAVHASQSREELLRSADSAYAQYNGYLPGQNLTQPLAIRSSWPNPTAGPVTISLDLKEQSELDVEVINAMGRFVDSWETKILYPGYNEISIDLSRQQTGVYFIRLSKGEFSEIFPITVHQK